ncbi:hypothetical protein V8E52_010428, partial [Russula decolorans]
VQVAPGGQLVYNPSNFAASIGTTVTFYFPKNSTPHSVTQGSFDKPCVYLAASGGNPAGFDSGLQSGKKFTLKITNDKEPIFFFCKTPLHCGLGMVGAINAPATGQSYAAYLAAAKSLGSNEKPINDNGPVTGGVGAVATAIPVVISSKSKASSSLKSSAPSSSKPSAPPTSSKPSAPPSSSQPSAPASKPSAPSSSQPSPPASKPTVPSSSQPSPPASKPTAPSSSQPSPPASKPTAPSSSQPSPPASKPTAPSSSQPSPPASKPTAPSPSQPSPPASKSAPPNTSQSKASDTPQSKVSDTPQSKVSDTPQSKVPNTPTPS